MSARLTADSFDRTNSTTNLGATDGSGSLDPITWVQQVGTWGINTNLAYTSASTAASIATVELSHADATFLITFSTIASTSGLVFRYVDASNYWRITATSSGGNLTLTNVNGGSASNTTIGVVSNGDAVRVTCNGSFIEVYKNNVFAGRITSANQSTATKYGLYNNSNTTARFNDLAASTVDTITLNNTVGISESFAAYQRKAALTGSVGITDYLAKRWQIRPTNSVRLSSAVALVGTLTQYDTWRPVPRPDNQLLLVCRTPEGDHDTTLTSNTLWTFHNDGSNENVVLETPDVYGWTTYGSPEWSPDGDTVAIWVETSTQYQLVQLDASDWERD